MEKTDLKTQLAEVAERIRTMREITGLSEGEMAKCTGVPLEEYQQCEAGRRTSASPLSTSAPSALALTPPT